MNRFKHQEDALQFILRLGGFGAIYHEMGLGKTRTAIDIYSVLRRATPDLKLLVITEPSLLERAWGDDIRKFTDLTYHNCNRDDLPTRDRLKTHPIVTINYELLIYKPKSQETELVMSRRNRADKEIGKMNALNAIAQYMSEFPFMIAVDESSRLRNHKSLTTAAALHLRDRAPYRVVLSGTPAPNGPVEYWGQMEFIQRGTLNSSFYQFQREFFHLERQSKFNRLGGGASEQLHGDMIPYSAQALSMMFSKGFKWAITEANREKLMKLVKSVSHFALKKDCQDLPEEIDIKREVKLGPKQRRAYNEMRRHLITQIEGEHVTGEVTLKKFMKLREIASGFAMNDDGESKAIGENAKMKELEKVLDEIDPSRQVIVWGHFRWEIEEIEKHLNKTYGERSARIYGRDYCSDPDQMIKDFQEGKFRFFVANPQSAGKGLTLTNCDTMIFFSLSYSWDQYYQSRSRIHRTGQKNNCTFVHILAEDTIDSRLLEVLRSKQETEAILYEIAKESQPA